MENCAELLLAHLPLVRALVVSCAQRQGLTREDAEDLESFTRLRLIEGDYRILRSYDGRGHLSSFLTVVVHRLFIDYRNQQWGQWKGSTGARHLGVAAQKLETLVHRDGLPPEEAVRRLEPEHPREELLKLLAELPAPRRLRLGHESAGPSADARDGRLSPEEAALQAESAKTARAALVSGFRRLAASDRLLLCLHFAHGLSVAAISRAYDQDVRVLYRRVHKLLRRLRRELARAGIRGEDVGRLIASHALGDWELLEPHRGTTEREETGALLERADLDQVARTGDGAVGPDGRDAQ